MRKFWYVTGRLTEVHRYINVPLHWWEQYPARERREFWLTRTDHVGDEMKLVVHSRSMPARCGHEVYVLLLGELVVGMANLTAGNQINFIRADPPLLLRRWDVLVTSGILVAGIALAVGWDERSLLLSLLFGVLYLPCQVVCRLLGRTLLRGQVDRMLEQASSEDVGSPRLWRVK